MVRWAERHFYIEETGQPIVLAPHQKAVLDFCLRRGPDGRLPFKTILWGQPKKSGKTAISGMVGRWAAETWGRYGEVLCVGNDAKQAQERGYKAAKISIELSPGFSRRKETLPGRWHVLTKDSTCLTTGTTMRAVATDYAGESGANPILVIWTELWGFTHTGDLRFWAEMGPSPTQPDSLQWIETYAGYDGESELLYGLYESSVKDGRQLTAGELGDLSAFAEAPNVNSLVPCYVNERASMFTYWDEGIAGRRMPWQTGEAGAKYYAAEAGRQTPDQMLRLHENQWVSAESAFVPMEWWDACKKDALPLKPGDKTPIVLALDAGVTGDCFGVVAVSRDPDNKTNGVAVRAVRKWTPPKGGAIDFDEPREAIRWFCKNFNVVQVAYDPYQLHDFATRLAREELTWFREFPQGIDRLKADSDLHKLIAERRIRHDGNPELREHVANANAKMSTTEDTKLRIVKKAESRKIDLLVCTSMGASECFRLTLD